MILCAIQVLLLTYVPWQSNRTDSVQQRLSSTSPVASTRFKFIAAQFPCWTTCLSLHLVRLYQILATGWHITPKRCGYGHVTVLQFCRLCDIARRPGLSSSAELLVWRVGSLWAQFLAIVNSCSRSLYAIAVQSVRLSVCLFVCNVRAPYSAG